MPRDQNGSYNLPAGTIVASGDTILPSQHNPAMQDIAQAITNSLSRDGNGGMRAPLDMGGFKVTGLGAGTAPTDAVRMDQIAGSGIPIGTPQFWFTDPPPLGYLLAYGQAVSRTDYPDLFAVFGTRFGAGDGSSTFNMPDCRGIVFAGLDNMGGAARGMLPGATTNGGTLGAATVTLDASQMPSHSHSGTTSKAGSHSHSVTLYTGSDTAQNAVVGQGKNLGPQSSQATSSAGEHSHAFTTDSQGGGQAHPNVQPTMAVNIIIKARNV